MKRVIASLACLVILSMTALPAAAQTRSRSNTRRSLENSRYNQRYNNRDYRVYRNNANRDDSRYEDYRYGDYEDRSVWEQSRDKITTAGGAVGGAALGALISGKKGAIIGAITGGVGAAIYTYKIRDKGREY